MKNRLEQLGAWTDILLRVITWCFTVISGLLASFAAMAAVGAPVYRWLEHHWGTEHGLQAMVLAMAAGTVAACPFWWGLWRLRRSALSYRAKGKGGVP